MTKTEAREKLEQIMGGWKADAEGPTLEQFLAVTYLPVMMRRWKDSTASTTVNRIEAHIIKKLGAMQLSSIRRPALQEFIDAKAQAGLSASTVKHLRWDLNKIFRFAQAEGIIKLQPAQELEVPEILRPQGRVMTLRDVSIMLSALDIESLLIVQLATICGLRPGEIFGLQWKHVYEDHVEIEQRVYRGVVGTPKTHRSSRKAAISLETHNSFCRWKAQCPGTGDNNWVFPSETLKTPADRWNTMHRRIRPALTKVGLGWVTYQTMRRTHPSLMRELGQDPKTVSDQLGHTLGVDLNVYTQTSVEYRRAALAELESALANGETKQ